MVTFADAASGRDAHWCVIVTIDGVGEYGSDATTATGRWKFCSEVPTYAAADSTYKPWLVEWPDVLSERVEILGGAPDTGELSIVILDGHDGDRDALSSKLRTSARSAGYLSAAMTAATTSAATNSDTPYTAASSVVFVGAEAMKVSAKPGSNILTVTRGCLGTDAQVHKANDRISLYVPSLRSRRVRLYLVPKDGVSSADETQFGPDYYLDDFGFDETLNAYVIRARGQRKYLDRIVPHTPVSMTVRRLPAGNGSAFNMRIVDPFRSSRDWLDQQWPNDKIFLRFGDTDQEDGAEIISMTPTWLDTTSILAAPGTRGIASTRLDGEIRVSDTVWPVYVADATLPGSIRYSPGPTPSASLSSGTWRPSDHWIDIILWLATSSAHPDDGLYLTNYLTSGTNDAKSNWSSAPVGVGAGIPVAKIDVAGLLALRERTPHDRFPGYYVGHPTKEKESFLEHITRWFLRPLGAFATLNDGQFGIVLPRVPLENESTTAVGNAQILVDGEATPYLPGIGARKDMTLLASRVTYTTRGPGGSKEIVHVTNSDFAGLYGQAGYYADEEQTVEIDAPGIAPTLLREFAMRRLWRFHRPLWALTFSTDFALYSISPGDLVAISCDELPNESTGARGWTSVPCQIVERAIKIDPKGRGVTIAWKAVGFGPGARFGRIPPSAYVTGFSGNTVTINENRYTQSDALSLAVTDAATFTVTDNLALKNLDGSSVTSKRESVDSKSGNVLTMSGNFDGNIAVGKVLVYAPSADATATQLASYVYFSDQANGTVGATAATAWSYAES